MPRRFWIGTISAFCGCLAGIFTLPAHAREWTFRPSISVTDTYTDNVLLASQGAEGDLLASLDPGISIVGKTRRLKLYSYYRLQNRHYLDHSELNDLTNFLGTNGSFEAIKDNLFVDFTASVFPTHEQTFGRLSNRNSRNIGENQVDVTSFGITPRFTYRLGSLANLTASLGYSDTNTGRNSNSTNTSSVAGSSTNDEQRVRLESLPNRGRIGWFTAYERTHETRQEAGASDSNLERVDVGGSYRINRFLSVTGSVGYEKNNLNGGTNQSGKTWSIGGVIKPGPRTSISGRFAHRAFGDSKSFDFSYKLRRITIGGSYSEDLQTTSNLLRQNRVFQTRDVFGNPIANPNPDGNVGIPINLLGLTNDVFISRTLNASVGVRQKRGLLTIAIYRTEQVSASAAALAANGESVIGTSLNWSHELGHRLSSGISADYQTRSTGVASGAQNSLFVSPFLAYQLGEHLSSRVSYTYANETSDAGLSTIGGSFVENALAATLSYTY